jgi:hypothetical protein
MSTFKPKFPPRPAKQIEYCPRPRPRPRTTAQALPAAVELGPVVVRPKHAYVRSEAYRRLVAAMPCIHCGIEGYSQAAHSDAGADGKGGAIKADDDTCYPACAPRIGVPGCHWLIGSSNHFPRELKRSIERLYAQHTRETLGVTPSDS